MNERPVPAPDALASAETRAHASCLRIAVLIPCYNEAASIRDVVRGFRAVLPGAVVYVLAIPALPRAGEPCRDARGDCP